MLNDMIKGVVKIAVLLALVKFVLLPMLPGSMNFGSGFPSPADLWKDPMKFGKEAMAAFDPTKIFANAPKPPSVALPSPPSREEVAQAGRDLDQQRLRTQHSVEQTVHDALSNPPKPF